MSNESRSLFVRRSEFYSTLAVVWLVVFAIGGILERANDSVTRMILSVLGMGLCVAYTLLAIQARTAERKAQRENSEGADQGQAT